MSTVNEYLRVNRAYIHDSGSSPANEGGIYIGGGASVAGVNANPLAYIDPLYGQTMMLVYTIPANCTGYMETLTVSTFGSNKEFEFYLVIEEFGESVRRIEEFHLGEVEFQNLYIPPRPLKARTDVYAFCEVTVGGGLVSAAFDIILVADGFEDIPDEASASNNMLLYLMLAAFIMLGLGFTLRGKRR